MRDDFSLCMNFGEFIGLIGVFVNWNRFFEWFNEDNWLSLYFYIGIVGIFLLVFLWWFFGFVFFGLV